MDRRRRAVLASCGSLLAATAGCLGDDGGSGVTTATEVYDPAEDDDADDGFAPAASLPDDPPSVDADPSSFDTTTTYDIEVPLVPAEVAFKWFLRREARFADARGSTQYQRAHVPGAVHSPAPTGLQEDDPANAWPQDARIVTYCGCPHHLSSQRAARLIEDGRDAVYAIDEGFRTDNGGWLHRGYPAVGNGQNAQAYVVSGRTDPADAGDFAWAEHDGGAQQEAAPIAEDGSYEMTLHFSGLSAQSLVTVRTPSYEVTKPLGEVTETVVTGE